MEVLATINSVWDSIFTFLKPVLAALVGWLLTAFQGWIGAKAASEKVVQVNQLDAQVGNASTVATQAVSQTFLKDNSEPGASLSATVAKQASSQALSLLKVNLGPKTLDLLKKAKGLDDFTLDAYLKSQIEAAVHKTKQGEVAQETVVVSAKKVKN